MKSAFVVVLCVVCAACLVACERTASTEVPAVANQEAAGTPQAAKAGGYEPTADERIPGITMSQQELDKIYTEARRQQPQPATP
ncbi:hypothetical protein [Methylophilus sp. 5]|uniref:hypothetical protein n=1 Tax=Methylophilus sp. 5 TaxID=1112274 RepID=UPI0004915FFE|nr:hypothetical protein [Methylophilus sp. 5]